MVGGSVENTLTGCFFFSHATTKFRRGYFEKALSISLIMILISALFWLDAEVRIPRQQADGSGEKNLV